MPKVGMQPIRRQQLIEATLESVHRYGMQDTTIARISRGAGVSSGIISHYFGNKDGLLEATMRWILSDLGRGVVARTVRANTPRERIEAIIDGNFALQQVSPRAVTTWLAFWAQAVHVPALNRLQNINARRLYSNLRYSFKALLPEERASVAAAGLAAIIDGLWLRGAFEASGIDAEFAGRVARNYLELQLRPIGDIR